jgi:hypothetical protein
MPIIFVHGIPSYLSELAESCADTTLEDLCDRIRTQAAAIPELGITKEQVTVFFTSDLLQKGLGEEIIIFVRGLFEKPERTQEVRDRLAQAMIDCLDGLATILRTTLVECFVESFNPNSGFASKRISASRPSRE